ncbi:MAG: hypothetical protein HOI67_14845 [Gammaproteobacteria bacterium]|jgi:hypothetical protein|nr:hypothetical protein [Gammaproteobacteria bacterium]
MFTESSGASSDCAEGLVESFGIEFPNDDPNAIPAINSQCERNEPGKQCSWIAMFLENNVRGKKCAWYVCFWRLGWLPANQERRESEL